VCGVRVVALNILSKRRRTADNGLSSSLWGLGEVLTTPHLKSGLVTSRLQLSRAWTDRMVQPKERNNRG
jgi:hypothetical protein